MEVPDSIHAEAIVAEKLAEAATSPPIQSRAKDDEAPPAAMLIPPPLRRSSLSAEHLFPGEMNDRKKGVRAWLHGMKESAKSNYFGVKQRLRGPSTSSVDKMMRNASPQEQRELLKLIEANINHSDVHTVAALYTVACDHHDLPEFKEAHERVCRILESLPQAQLVEVRDLIDRTSEGRGFLPLVLSGGKEHYNVLASKFAANLTEGYLPSRRCLKIFSDIDDTVIANWVDVRGYSRYNWEPRTVYPGARELHNQIMQHANNESDRTVDLIFLSSRPLKHQLLTIGALKAYGFGVPHPGNFTVLYGEFWSNLSPRMMGVFKYEMFKLYAGLYPRMDYVFFGDSGQGDFVCGESMLKNPNLKSSRMRGVFIHEIRRSEEIYRQVDLSTPTEHLHYFYHYGQAAKQALGDGLISKEGYEKCLLAFKNESRMLAEAKLGNREAILATFSESLENDTADHPDANKQPLAQADPAPTKTA
eukprot:Mycagemm_TRINITY_DN10277_c0_g1::TRINITY_DN10277_c0_g1_i2::g.4039::m.4039 type:complete len:475 gc:universal TRINITY_DN10277_c0_g1_i2:51-1475(+)